MSGDREAIRSLAKLRKDVAAELANLAELRFLVRQYLDTFDEDPPSAWAELPRGQRLNDLARHMRELGDL